LAANCRRGRSRRGTPPRERFGESPELARSCLSHTLVTDLSPLARLGNPVTVRVVGLADEVVEAARGLAGIVVVED